MAFFFRIDMPAQMAHLEWELNPISKLEREVIRSSVFLACCIWGRASILSRSQVEKGNPDLLAVLAWSLAFATQS